MLTRHAQTDAQGETLQLFDAWKLPLRYGTSIGKSPQTVILDSKTHHGVLYVNRDGEVTCDGEEVFLSPHAVKEAIKTFEETYEKD